MREKCIEIQLRNEARKRGGLCLKWVSPGTKGVPDRIIIWPGGRIHFIEVKTKAGVLSGSQQHIFCELINHRADVFIIRGMDDVSRYMKKIDEDLKDDEL